MAVSPTFRVNLFLRPRFLQIGKCRCPYRHFYSLCPDFAGSHAALPDTALPRPQSPASLFGPCGTFLDSSVVARERLELSHPCGYLILSQARLPFRHPAPLRHWRPARQAAARRPLKGSSLSGLWQAPDTDRHGRIPTDTDRHGAHHAACHYARKRIP